MNSASTHQVVSNALAKTLESLVRSKTAELFYDLMSDALVWSDEIPKPGSEIRVGDLWHLRPILRYRSSLILGVPDVPYEHGWNAARLSFPNWIGFLVERRAPELAAKYIELKAVSEASLARFTRDNAHCT